MSTNTEHESRTKYLEGLRTGNPQASFGKDTNESVVENVLSDNSRSDFANFERFLLRNGNTSPQPADLYLTAPRESVIRMLQYADERHCLVLQNCFGFDLPVADGGRVQLIQKGNMWQYAPDLTDEVVFDTVYKVFRNGRKYFELYLNMDPDHQLATGKGMKYTKNFRAYYAGRTMQHDPFIHGFLFPVKALLTIFTDPSTSLGSDENLTFRWGLTRYYNDGTMGNFTLVIGTGDVTTGSVIEFRTEAIEPAGENDCPPNKACMA